MKIIHKIALLALLLVGAGLLIMVLAQGSSIAVLDPKGSIAAQQRDLIVITVLLMMIVVIPVFVMTFLFAFKFRASNTKASYTPNWDHNKTLESIWWGVPLAIILVLSIITWISSHELDPYRPISSDKQPVRVQVIALQWKWLFLYPDHNVATVNFFRFPEKTPINFDLTADAPMNSFWIPQLGGQVYAMPGMSTKLHLISNETGKFKGVSANLSGEGFANMKFLATAENEDDFKEWIAGVKQSEKSLTNEEYEKLIKPSKGDKAIAYSSFDKGLYDRIIGKYMNHGHQKAEESTRH